MSAQSTKSCVLLLCGMTAGVLGSSRRAADTFKSRPLALGSVLGSAGALRSPRASPLLFPPHSPTHSSVWMFGDASAPSICHQIISLSRLIEQRFCISELRGSASDKRLIAAPPAPRGSSVLMRGEAPRARCRKGRGRFL